MISLIEKNVLANFLNGPVSKNSIFFSKIFPEKVMVINYCFIVIYQLNINMRPTRHENINFLSSCKIFKEKVRVINFCFIVIYQLNINMRPTRHENIYFYSLCKKIKNPFFLIFRILMKDKKR